MKTVIMDTSTVYLVVALYEQGKCVQAMQKQGKQRQSEEAIIILQALLKKQGWHMLDIDEMIITLGPGSYTGVRVAMTIAKTLAVTTKIKMKAISSLLAYAGLSKAISIIDARSEKIFVGAFFQGKAVSAEEIIDIDTFASFYAKYPGYVLIGDRSVPGFEIQKPCALYETIYQTAMLAPYVQMETLVPNYIKAVGVKPR